MIQLFPHNSGAYTHWLASALQDEKVWPYLTGEPSFDTRINVADEFVQAHFISESGAAFASLYFNRRKYSARAKLHVVSLDGDLTRKRKEALAAYKFLCHNGHLFKRFHILNIDFSVHATNEDALSFYSRMEPWGIEPQGLFDRRLQCWVDAHHFRVSDALIKKLAPGLVK